LNNNQHLTIAISNCLFSLTLKISAEFSIWCSLLAKLSANLHNDLKCAEKQYSYNPIAKEFTKPTYFALRQVGNSS